MFDDKFKFRAWDPVKKVMTYSTGANQIMYGGDSDDIGLGLSLHWSIKNGYHDIPTKLRSFEECVFMLWTGLRDSSARFIYDGDIVQESAIGRGILNKGAVEMNSLTDWTWAGFGTIHSALTWGGNTFKVIGNIYENPDLLK